ncbi:hypothetical protein [Natrarchaeobaculum sulfurireducens]|uniref:Uncharacterized protein n=1 Tax=Natrarchaeobaculum sulfurireducens TaxID=2044521 RepID=A0A346PHK6_9EURY|nr:hypothetical protein [Natrarchaeobaculum sulfurireducens]AXR79001.1 hypothetical protein AArc1_2688 [Natrarchaeobaculum sulfurireducens]
MSDKRPLIIPHRVVEHNRRLESTLNRRLSVTLATYKSIEAMAELAVVALAFYSIYHGADPLLAFALTAVVVGGWKVVEFLAVYADDLAEARDAVDGSD